MEASSSTMRMASCWPAGACGWLAMALGAAGRTGRAGARQPDAELGAVAGARAQVDAALVGPHDRAHDREAEPAARLAARPGRLAPLELLEDALLLVALD